MDETNVMTSENIQEEPLNSKITTRLVLIIPNTEKKSETSKKARKVLHYIGLGITYLILAFFAFIILLPFYYMIAASLMSESELNSGAFFPTITDILDNLIYNYSQTVNSNGFNFVSLFTNTLLVALSTTCGSLLVTILSAFAFSKLEFKGKDGLFVILLATMMIPGEMLIITNFSTMANMGLISRYQNSVQAALTLILPFISNVFYIYLLRQNFKQIPDELYLAAKVDGKTDWQFLWKVMVPLAMPTLITIFIMNLIDSWNSYAWPSLVIMSDSFNVISVALRSTTFQIYEHEQWVSQYTWQMAATVLTTLPLLILFILFRKYIMSGVARAGIKG